MRGAEELAGSRLSLPVFLGALVYQGNKQAPNSLPGWSHLYPEPRNQALEQKGCSGSGQLLPAPAQGTFLAIQAALEAQSFLPGTFPSYSPTVCPTNMGKEPATAALTAKH